MQLIHEVLLIVQAPRRVYDQDVAAAGFCGRNSVIDDRSGIGTVLPADDRHTGSVGPHGQLFIGRGAVSICCRNDDFPAVSLENGSQLADGSRLSGSVYPDNENHGFTLLKCIVLVRGLHARADALNEQITALDRLLHSLLTHFFAQLIKYLFRSPNPDVPLDHDFLKVVIEFFIDLLVPVHDIIDAADQHLLGLVETAYKLLKKIKCHTIYS